MPPVQPVDEGRQAYSKLKAVLQASTVVAEFIRGRRSIEAMKVRGEEDAGVEPFRAEAKTALDEREGDFPAEGLRQVGQQQQTPPTDA